MSQGVKELIITIIIIIVINVNINNKNCIIIFTVFSPIIVLKYGLFIRKI